MIGFPSFFSSATCVSTVASGIERAPGMWPDSNDAASRTSTMMAAFVSYSFLNSVHSTRSFGEAS